MSVEMALTRIPKMRYMSLRELIVQVLIVPVLIVLLILLIGVVGVVGLACFVLMELGRKFGRIISSFGR